MKKIILIILITLLSVMGYSQNQSIFVVPNSTSLFKSYVDTTRVVYDAQMKVFYSLKEVGTLTSSLSSTTNKIATTLDMSRFSNIELSLPHIDEHIYTSIATEYSNYTLIP